MDDSVTSALGFLKSVAHVSWAQQYRDRHQHQRFTLLTLLSSYPQSQYVSNHARLISTLGASPVALNRSRKEFTDRAPKLKAKRTVRRSYL